MLLGRRKAGSRADETALDRLRDAEVERTKVAGDRATV
jgi:hypothetical protein